MPTYRRIETELQFAEQIWHAEEKFPKWFVKSSAVWTKNFDEFLAFWKNCAEIYGLFSDDGDLQACVYLEFLNNYSVNIHVSVIAQTPQRLLVRFFRNLKEQKFNDGVLNFTGWIMAKNHPLFAIAEKAGFKPTGAEMMSGAINGREIVWKEVRG